MVTPGNGVVVQYRAAQGGTTSQVATTGTAPTYLMVARAGTTFTAYTSPDGANWLAVPGSNKTLANLTGALLAGMAVTSHNTGALSAVAYDTVTIAAGSPPTNPCPTGWTCADIGNPTPAGSQTLSNGTWTIQGGGADIYGTADAFRLVNQSLAGDGSVSAHITAQSNSSGWAKAGVMLRLTNDPGSPYYAVFMTPANGVTAQYRTTQGGTTGSVKTTGTTPAYLKVTRAGTTFTAYTSTDGVTWTLVPNSTKTMTNLTGALLGGLAVTSHNATTLSTAMFDTVTVH
jgi:hypothetical protein